MVPYSAAVRTRQASGMLGLYQQTNERQEKEAWLIFSRNSINKKRTGLDTKAICKI
jgi:hypothetical protein